MGRAKDIVLKVIPATIAIPFVKAHQAQWIERARRGDPQVIREKLYGIRPDGSRSRFCTSSEWRRLFNAPFRISAECCNEMKKKPLKKYAHETGRVPIIGTMASESKLREKNWLKTGCNAFEAKRPVSMPMSFWLEKDVWEYLRKYQVPYCKIYDMGYERTGCVFCMFGAHLDAEPTRDCVARLLFGEYARLNFQKGGGRRGPH